MRYFADYDRATGVILRCGPLPGEFAEKILDLHPEFIELAETPDPTTQKVNLATRQLIARTASEMLPLRAHVDLEIRNALGASDFTQVIDAPFSDMERQAWRAYRQALRDLSKLPTVEHMVAQWPARPDGQEPPFR